MADLRKYARQTSASLLIGFILILFLVGDGLIYIFYGKAAAISGAVCLLAVLAPVLIIWLVLVIMEWFVKRSSS